MASTRNWSWRTAIGSLALTALAGTVIIGPGTVHALDAQNDFVFDVLGSIVCELPPPSFDISQFRAYATNTPEAPLARGEIVGAFDAAFAGGALYGTDKGGGYVVGVQGMLLDGDPELRMLCLVFVRLGAFDAQAEITAAIIGEDGLDAASDGDFLGVFKIVRRNAEGESETVGAGRVQSGTARIQSIEGGSIAGTISMEGTHTTIGGGQEVPFSATVAFPAAQNVIRPALRLNRN